MTDPLASAIANAAIADHLGESRGEVAKKLRMPLNGTDGYYYKVGDRLVPSQPLVQEAVSILLRHVGLDPASHGLADTPDRVVRMLSEMTAGYKEEPKEILKRIFEEDCDEVVISKDIPFVSLCEHHLLVFEGTADIGYLPRAGKIVGLSKLARLVDCFAKRLQVQERLTKQIAEAIREHLYPRGVAVVMRAEHSCMSCRGVKKTGSVMVTSSMLGVFRDDPGTRAEFLALCSR